MDDRVLEKELKECTEELLNAYNNKDYYKAVCFMKFLSSFYYLYNTKLTDDILEDMLKKIADEYLGKTVFEKAFEDKVIFYDGFGLVNRGLANIYVKALSNLQYKVIWILPEFSEENDLIKEKFINVENVNFEVIPKGNIMERMRWLQSAFKKHCPGNILIYTRPDDVAGLAVCATIEGNVKRYLIDLTDHAYWLGKNATDYIVGFRKVGCNVAMQYRGIEKSKIIMLPYYPEERENYAYEGMPFGEKEFIFSGGSVYKIEGESTYEEIVDAILNKYTNINFVYAGNGQSEKLDYLRQKYEGRFYQIKERKDLDGVLQKAKFYLDTYPISGALMTQYALQNECVPLVLFDKNRILVNPSTWLLNSEDIDFAFASKEELLKKVDSIMQGNGYKGKNLKSYVISAQAFQEQLNLLLKNQETDFLWEEEKIELQPFFDLYKKNMSYERYCKILYDSHNPWIWEKHKDIIENVKAKL